MDAKWWQKLIKRAKMFQENNPSSLSFEKKNDEWSLNVRIFTQDVNNLN